MEPFDAGFLFLRIIANAVTTEIAMVVRDMELGQEA